MLKVSTPIRAAFRREPPAQSRAESALSSFFDSAEAAGEVTLTRARVAILAIFVVWLIGIDWSDLGSGHGPKWGRLLAIAFWTVVAFVMHARLRAHRDARFVLRLSWVLDPVVIATVYLPALFGTDHPRPYRGVLGGMEGSAFLLSTLVAAARLRGRAKAVAIVANFVVFVALIVVDSRYGNGTGVAYPIGALGMSILFVVAAAVVGHGIGVRARRLVIDGAESVLVAERAAHRLRAYVPEAVANAALRNSAVDLGGDRSEIAVLFSDLRGFTERARLVPPEALVGELNAYFEAMAEPIAKEGGLINNYIGDAILAVFGTPTPDPAAALHAVRAAHGMREALFRHNAVRAERGLPPLRHGVGVHVGLAVCGHVGTQERAQYTVIGDVVNVASRLEGATKSVGRDVLVSAQAANAARVDSDGGELPPLESAGEVRLAGIAQPVPVFGIGGPAPPPTTPDLSSLPPGTGQPGSAESEA